MVSVMLSWRMRPVAYPESRHIAKLRHNYVDVDTAMDGMNPLLNAMTFQKEGAVGLI